MRIDGFRALERSIPLRKIWRGRMIDGHAHLTGSGVRSSVDALRPASRSPPGKAIPDTSRYKAFHRGYVSGAPFKRR